MFTFSVKSVMISIVLLLTSTSFIQAKPLKVFILCGQSNMEGHAQTKTIPAIAKDPKTADLYKDMVDAQGNPITCENVWISYAFGDFSGSPTGRRDGKLSAGWGSQHHIGTGKIGPEFTFGIYMNKMLNEPVLLIKNAWGGKSLMVDFRPPSGGELPEDLKEKSADKAGVYYKLMMDHVKEVLADPKKVCPAYDPKEGFELAGFVWFQGFNDLVGKYPVANASDKKSPKDYSEYSRLLACLIRDVRKDLNAPNLPFVIGVLGVGGEKAEGNTPAFRQAMAAPASMPEFKGSVVNVLTEKYWPVEIDQIQDKLQTARDESNKQTNALKKKELSASERKKEMDRINAEFEEKVKKTLNEDELYLYENGISNAAYHYHGSAKFFALAGKGFAEALVNLKTAK